MDQADADRLVARVKAGDRTAFGQIVEAFGRRIYSFVFRMTGRHELADEIVQETFLRAFRNLDRYGGGRLISWLNGIAYNICLDTLKSASSRTEREKRFAGARDIARGGKNDVEWTVLKRDLMERVAAAVGELPERQRAAIVLFAAEGFSIREVAQIMNCSEGAVMSHLHRARRKLKTVLSESEINMEEISE